MTDTTRDRFMANVESGPDGCWLWQANQSSLGYAVLVTPGPKYRSARDVAHELFVGPVPVEHKIVMDCGDKLCVYPGHFEVVTAEEYNHRAAAQAAPCQH